MSPGSDFMFNMIHHLYLLILEILVLIFPLPPFAICSDRTDVITVEMKSDCFHLVSSTHLRGNIPFVDVMKNTGTIYEMLVQGLVFNEKTNNKSHYWY